MKTLKESIKESFEILLENISFDTPQGITCGYPDFDNMLRGIRRGCLTVLASKPALGKTAFALNIVLNLTERTPETAVLFCSDLSNTELTFRLLTIASGVKNNYNTDYKSDDMERLMDSVNKLKEYPLYFEEHSGMDEEFQAKIQAVHAEHNIELLIVDNVCPEACRQLKVLAKELDIAVLALIPLYSKKDEIVCRGTADTLVILHRDRKADHAPELGAPAELIVAKNRHGLCGSCRIYFIPEIMLFKESCTGEPLPNPAAVK